MKKITLFTAVALAAIANPVNAQILGGGLGGVIGGAGSVARSLPTLPPMPPVTSSTIGNVTGSATAATSHSADTRSGQVRASGSASGKGSADTNQSLTGPLGNVAGSGRGSAQAGGAGSADAQLIGTDGLTGTVQTVRGTAGQTVGTVRDTTTSTVQGARTQAGSALNGLGTATGSANGSLTGMLNGSAGNLALAGSAASDVAGTFDVKPGMKLFDADGEKIGKVRQVIADAQGNVQALVVKVDNATATLPASAFSVDGNVLVSVVGEGQIKSIAADQASNSDAQGSASGN